MCAAMTTSPVFHFQLEYVAGSTLVRGWVRAPLAILHNVISNFWNYRRSLQEMR